jgi:hypothetical protein
MIGYKRTKKKEFDRETYNIFSYIDLMMYDGQKFNAGNKEDKIVYQKSWKGDCKNIPDRISIYYEREDITDEYNLLG